MKSVRHHFYFSLAMITAGASAAFLVVAAQGAINDINMVESSISHVVMNSHAREARAISRELDNVSVNELDDNFQQIDQNINQL